MIDPTAFYEKQISLTEWFEALGHPQAATLRLEDNDKRERLHILNKIIGLPFDKPTQFSASAVAARTGAFKKFLREHGNELCAVRIIPDTPTLPKFRMRGRSIAEGTQWFDKQPIDNAHYRVDFVPHTSTEWATIFVVSKQGIFGELTKGEHNELTQGLYKTHEPITFHYDFKKWHFSTHEPNAETHVRDIITYLHVDDQHKQVLLQKELNSTFAHNYLQGYFETTASHDRGIWFIDYNRLLGDIYTATVAHQQPIDALVTGRCSSPGVASGTVHIVAPKDVKDTRLAKNEVLVCPMTTPDYLPLMQQADAIVTDLGGVLSHAAIVARELKKPCITGTKNATSILKNGQNVTVNADLGSVIAT